MDEEKKKRLEKRGWKVGNAEDFVKEVFPGNKGGEKITKVVLALQVKTLKVSENFSLDQKREKNPKDIKK